MREHNKIENVITNKDPLWEEMFNERNIYPLIYEIQLLRSIVCNLPDEMWHSEKSIPDINSAIIVKDNGDCFYEIYSGQPLTNKWLNANIPLIEEDLSIQEISGRISDLMKRFKDMTSEISNLTKLVHEHHSRIVNLTEQVAVANYKLQNK